MRTLTWMTPLGRRRTITIRDHRRPRRSALVGQVYMLLYDFDQRMRQRFAEGFARIAEARNLGMTRAEILRSSSIERRM